MNTIYKYSLFVLVLLGSMGCKKEAKLISSDTENSISRYKFPQGNNIWDKHFEEIHDKYGIYIIYKDITNKDLNRTWTVATGISYYGSPVIDVQMQAYDNLLTNHVFPYLNLEHAKKVLPPYLLLQDDLYSLFGTAKVQQEDYYKGMDSWVTSLNPYQIANMAPDTLRMRRNRLINEVITRSVEKGLIVEPDNFKTGIDYTTAVVSAAGTEANPNHFLNRGFVHNVIASKFRSALAVSSITTVNKLNADFLCYIRIAMLYDEAEFRVKYPLVTYKLINTRYDLVTKWMKDKYGIDLKAIAIGPN